jgi:hypothetical protein
VEQSRALIRGFIDGTLVAAEHAQLEERLREPEAARLFLRELHFDQAIRVAARSQDRRVELEAAPQAPVTARLRVRRTSRWRPPMGSWSVAKAAALVLALLLPVVLGLTTRVVEPPFARLAVHLGTVTVGDQVRNGASDLATSGELLVSPRGWASLRLRDGTLIELSGGTWVRLEDGDAGVRLRLGSGSVNAEVRPQGPGRSLAIESTRSRATVLGTRLAFSTGAAGDQLEVSEGVVRCTRLGDGDSIEVPAGHRVTVVEDAPLILATLRPAVVPVADPPSRGLLLWLDAGHGVESDGDGRISRWRDRSGKGHVAAADQPAHRPLLVQDDGRPALLFAPRNQRMTAQVPWPTTGAFTFALALRADQLGRWSQSVGWSWGCFAFHGDERGGVYAGVGAPGGGIRFEPGGGAEDIPRGTIRRGQWQHFVIAYGNGIGAFYADGRLLARKAMPAPTPRPELHLGRADTPSNEPFGFGGALSQVLLYDRILEPDEIAVLDRRLRHQVAP